MATDSGGDIPRVTDNDRDEISITYQGKQLRGWSYGNEAEQREMMGCAREYAEGWCDGRETERTWHYIRSLHIRADLRGAIDAFLDKRFPLKEG